MILNKDVCMFS